ncbi:MAG: VCBS repeat-containing protein [Planctomycetota bacterium]
MARFRTSEAAHRRRTAAAAGVFALFSCGVAHAQVGPWRSHWLGSSASSASATEMADLDADGDLDLLFSAAGERRVGWYENLAGDGTLWMERAVAQGLGWVQAARAADFDGDGDLEAIAIAQDTGEVTWHENRFGDGLVWETHLVTVAMLNGQDVYPADVDGDGDVDILACGGAFFPAEGKVAWFENQGPGAGAWAEHVITTNLAFAASVRADDLDGDGDRDVVVGARGDNRVTWYDNLAGDGQTWAQGVVADGVDAAGVHLVDVDGDGFPDVLSASDSDDRIAWHENVNGDASLWVSHVIATDAEGAESVFAADVDGDLHVDVLAASFSDDTVAWYRNVAGDGSAWTEHPIALDADGVVAVCAGDVDQDGDPDVVSADLLSARIRYYPNRSHFATPWPVKTVSTPADGVQALHVVDLDGDGDLDALSGSFEARSVAWYENVSGDGSVSVARPVRAPGFTASALDTGDVNGDGELDILAAGGDEVLWFERRAGDAWIEHTVTSSTQYASAVQGADLDGDGDLDVSAGAWFSDPEVVWFENVGGGGLAWQLRPIGGSFQFRPSDIDVGDIDHDGDLDVIAGFWSFTNPDRVIWYENVDGVATSWAATTVPGVIGQQLDDVRSVHLADVNADGRLDFLTASSGDEQVAWYENELGDGSSWLYHSILVGVDAWSVHAADMDGDGDLDALSSGRLDGRVAWHENQDGAGTLWTEHVLSGFADLARGVHAADADGDGDPDVYSAEGNEVVLYENLALAAVQTPRPGSPPNPNAFLPGATSPAPGTVWDPAIDHTSFAPSAQLDFAYVSPTALNVPTSLGTVLCSPPAASAIQVVPWGQPFAFEIPDHFILIGTSFCAQGGSIGALASPLLTNALDVTIGTY